MFSMFFVRRPVFSFVTAIFICIIGLASLLSLPISQYPNIMLPTINVAATYPGADAQTIQDTVAAPIEQQVNGAIDMLYMSSKSNSNGTYSLSVTFALERNLDLAQVDVQNRISQVSASLPAAVTAQGLLVTQQSPDMLMVLSVFSPGDIYDQTFLSNYTTINIVDRLKRTEGVGNVSVFNQTDYSMRIWVRPDVLAKLGIGADTISQAIKGQNLQAPVGQIGAPPFADGQEVAFQYTVTTKGRLTTAEEFGNIILKTNLDGSYVRMRDVGRIELGTASYSSYGRFNSQPAVLMGIYQRPNGNAIQTVKNINSALDDLKKSFPNGVEIRTNYDSTRFVNSSIKEVISTLLEAFVLVLIVVFVFLQNWRATLIPMIAVPVSLLGTFGFFIALGFSINTLTLFALVLAIGIVVDDAIVVVEAVSEKLEHGLMPYDATEAAMKEVGGPVVAIALVLIAVFVPVAFLGGITGELYKQFALTLSMSVLLSAFVALTLTPTMCALFLKPHKPMGGPVGYFFKGFNWIFDKTINGYGRTVKMLCRKSFLGLVAVIGVCLFSLHMVKRLPTSFVPDEDQGFILASMSLSDATSLKKTDNVSRDVEKIIHGIPGVSDVCTIGGLDIFSGINASNYCSYIIVLDDWSKRDGPNLSQSEILAEIYKRTFVVPNARLMATGIPALPGLGNQGGVQFELQNRVGGTPAELGENTNKMLAALMQNPKISMAYSMFRANVPGLFLNVDRDKSETMGVNISSVFTNLNSYLGGAYINDFNLFGRTYQVYVQAEPQYRSVPDDIAQIFVPGKTNNLVPLGAILQTKANNGPISVVRYNLYPTAEITVQGKPGVANGELMQILEDTASKTLPQGYGYEYTGMAYQQKNASSDQTVTLAMAVIFVFLFLAALYESWAIPFAVLFALPFGVMGAFAGQLFRGFANDTYCQIGLVMLMGLAAKNAILIVEYAKVRRDHGYSIIKAAVEASKLRLRPILMTSFAFILGVVPLMLSDGAGAGARTSMGTAVFSGMLCATSIGIFLIPQLYAWVQKTADFMNRVPKDDPAKEDVIPDVHDEQKHE